ncbi:acyl-CoA thioesterase [Halosegnis sp.]|uniref:acyl-CoA thioesterase n=1 Tax=Halosegnis sp. TaxID=2864959 RepID=UPI0035D3FE71
MTGRTYTHDIAVQFRDLDTRAHVNHVVYGAYFERAKERFFADVLGVPLAEAPTVVRSLKIEYERPLGPADKVTVTLGPVETGETSITIAYTLETDAPVATGQTVSVYLVDGEPAPLPEEWRAALAPYAE